MQRVKAKMQEEFTSGFIRWIIKHIDMHASLLRIQTLAKLMTIALIEGLRLRLRCY